jgi:murein L,D-transpeptidase YafK
MLQPSKARRIAALAALAVALTANPARADDPLQPGDHVDRIVIEKALRKLTLVKGDRPVRSYRVALGAQPTGHKRREGDERTPEGIYSIDARNPRSDFFLSLRISYPNETDVARARAAGEDPGGQIMIHGLRNGFGWLGDRHQRSDWTDGCVAVTNSEMLEIWRLVDLGTPVEIRP